jgi:hypothetical protein
VREGQKEGSNGGQRAPSSVDPVRVRKQQLERERESSATRKEGLASHLDPVGQFLVLPCLFVGSTRKEHEREGSRHIELCRPRKPRPERQMP